MATAVTGISIWFTRSPATDLSHLDMATQENGRIAVGFGGFSAGNALLHTALGPDGNLGGLIQFHADSDTANGAELSLDPGALTYEEQVRVPSPVSSTFDTAEQRILLQEVDEVTGAKVGGPVQIVGPTGVASDIIRLSDGRLLVVWQDTTRDATRLQGQILSADGDGKLGKAFDISAFQTGAGSPGDVIALPTGGFAVSWFNGVNHHLARMFAANGAATGHDFLLTDNGATDLIASAAELALSGSNLVAMTTGLQMDDSDQRMFGQVWSTASTKGLTRGGTAADQTRSGRAMDDRLSFENTGFDTAFVRQSCRLGCPSSPVTTPSAGPGSTSTPQPDCSARTTTGPQVRRRR